MKTIDPHSLLETPRTIENHGVILELYNIWKQLMSEKTDSGVSDFDAFIAGYFLGTNIILRKKYLETKHEEKFDPRVSNLLWK